MAAHAHFTQTELNNVGRDAMQEMLFSQRGINFNDFPTGFKRGRFVEKVTTTESVVYMDKRTGEERVAENVARSRWEIIEPPIWSREPDWLLLRISDLPAN